MLRPFQGKKTTSLADAVEALVAILISPPVTPKAPRVTLRRHVYDKKPLLQYTVYLEGDKETLDYGVAQVWVLTYPDTNEIELTPVARREILEFFELHPELEGTPSAVFTMVKMGQKTSRHQLEDLQFACDLIASALQGWEKKDEIPQVTVNTEDNLKGPDEA